MHFRYATVDAKLRFLTLNPFKWCAIFGNDRRYGALETSDKNGLPTVLTLLSFILQKVDSPFFILPFHAIHPF
jgi:hypothetical protein